MADPTDDDDEDDLVPIKRQPKMLSQRKSLPSVDGALDDFIVSANQKLLDTTEFTAESREKGLREDIAELEKKLAAAQARLDKQAAEAAEAPPPAAAPGRSWGGILVAFVLGGGIAFGAAKAMQPSAPSSVAARECPEPVQPQVASPAPPPVAPVVVAAPPVPAPPPPAPAPPTVAAKAPKPPKAPKAASPHATDSHDGVPAGKDPTVPTTKPPPAHDGSGSDLYNPF